jgi:hypothetical protein
MAVLNSAAYSKMYVKFMTLPTHFAVVLGLQTGITAL